MVCVDMKEREMVSITIIIIISFSIKALDQNGYVQSMSTELATCECMDG